MKGVNMYKSVQQAHLEEEINQAEEEAFARIDAQQDMVNHPPHYQSDSGIECIDAIRAALGKEGFIAYCRGNIIKYNWRDKVDASEDRKKAQWYQERMIEEMEK